MTYTEADFEQLSWHDCHLWGLAFRAGDANDLLSELALDIDFITEWLSGTDAKPCRFRVAPATLLFQEVTDLRVGLDWGSSGLPVALSPACIEAVARELIPDRIVYPGRPYYRWQIRFTWPTGAEMLFNAVGFTLTFQAEPVLSDTQYLLHRQR